MSSDGDRILIQTLSRGGQASSAALKPLAEWTADDIMVAAARCLNVVLDPPPFDAVPTAPESVSARYKMASDLADRCKSLGYQASGSDEVGYHTFLYCGGEKELRHLMTFLADLLPKDAAEEDSGAASIRGRRAEVMSGVAKALTWSSEDPASRDAFKADPRGGGISRDPLSGVVTKRGNEDCDDFCTCPVCLADLQSGSDLYRLLPKETRNAFASKRLICSSIQFNSNSGRFVESVPPSALPTERAPSKPEPEGPPDEARRPERPPEVQGPEERRSERSIAGETTRQVATAPPPPVPETDADIGSQEETEEGLLELESQVEALKAEFTTAQGVVKGLRKQVAEDSQAKEDLEAQLAKERQAAGRRETLLDLLESFEDSCETLEAKVAGQKDKLSLMKEEWDKVRAELEAEHANLEQELEARNESKTVSSREKLAARAAAEELAAKIRSKELLEAKLLDQLQRVSTDFVPRNHYTGQIKETLKNIAKQKLETAKMIQDIRAAQSDINISEGKLFRTYAEADSLIFEVAQRDAQLVPAYKLLTAIHETGESVVEAIREAGRVKRATKRLQDQAEAERAKNVGDNVAKLLRDLDAIRTENSALASKLQMVAQRYAK